MSTPRRASGVTLLALSTALALVPAPAAALETTCVDAACAGSQRWTSGSADCDEPNGSVLWWGHAGVDRDEARGGASLAIDCRTWNDTQGRTWRHDEARILVWTEETEHTETTRFYATWTAEREVASGSGICTLRWQSAGYPSGTGLGSGQRGCYVPVVWKPLPPPTDLAEVLP